MQKDGAGSTVTIHSTFKIFDMPYEELLNCSDELDQHYCGPCATANMEKARIRRGGWLHKSVIAIILANPTNAALWATAKADGKFIPLPELSGTFDGGSPVYTPGYGDQKERYAGSNFTAAVKDPVYAPNWEHYNSLAGKTTWHFVYCTGSKMHITGVPVTVAPKNPVTENPDDDVVWDSEVKWFETFTPKPHDIPAGVFECTTEELEEITFKFGFIATGVPDADDIAAANPDTEIAGGTLTVPAGGFGNTTDAIVFMAEPVTEPAKTIWYNTAINNGAIGAGETFLSTTVGAYRVYYTSAATSFTGSVQFRIS